jgi:Membrane protein of unknown function.
MKFLSRLVLQVLLNALGIFLIIKMVPEVSFTGDLKILILTAFVLGILNFVLKPILKLILGPLIALTLGLFTLIINAFILWLATQLVNGLVIPIGWPLIWSTLIMSIINILFHLFAKK